MNYSKKKAPLLKRKKIIEDRILPLNQEIEFITAQLNLFDEYEKVRHEAEPELFEPEPDEGKP